MSVIKRENNMTAANSNSETSDTAASPRPASKNFPLSAVLSLSTGLLLDKAPQALYELVGFIMEDEASAAQTAVRAKDAKHCLEEQLPFLKDLDLTLLYAAYKSNSAKLEEHLDIWVNIQKKKYGASFDLIPYSRWQRRKNSHKL